MAKTESKYSQIAEKSHSKVAAEKLQVSLDFLDWDHPEIFFVHGLEPEHYKKLFECLAELGRSTEEQIVQQTHPSLSPKSIFNNKNATINCFPDRIKDLLRHQLEGPKPDANINYATMAQNAIDRAFEVRIGRSYGRLHGFVLNKVFHVVWLDPAHNLYPDINDGVRGPAKYATVKGFGPAEVIDLKEKNRQLVEAMNNLQEKMNSLQKEHDELYEEYAKK